MSQFAVIHLTLVLKSLTRWMHGIGICHHPCKKASLNTQIKRKLNLQGAQVRTDPPNIVRLPPRKAWKDICSHTKLT